MGHEGTSVISTLALPEHEPDIVTAVAANAQGESS